MFEIVVICVVVTALLTYVNHRFVKLPMAIGVLVAMQLLSLAVMALDVTGVTHSLRVYEERLLRAVDFSDVVLQGMLSLLLFASALQIELRELRRYLWPVSLLAVVGTVASALLVGLLLWFALPFAGVSLSLLYCLLFGALISPTDPIAVMGVLQTAKAPKNLEVVIAGESLFNDGVAVSMFALLVGMLQGDATPSLAHSIYVMTRETGGGLVFGLLLGWACCMLVKGIDNYQVEVLMTLATALGGYELASHLHVSGPVAMVAAGLVIGNYGRKQAMSPTTRRNLDLFWELLDEMLNAVLFVLLGMQLLRVPFVPVVLAAGAVAIVVTLFARWLTVGVPVGLLRGAIRLPAGAGQVLTWGGVRGGVSVALALSVPPGPGREWLLSLTYVVVTFTLLVQGLSLRRVVRAALTPR